MVKKERTIRLWAIALTILFFAVAPIVSAGSADIGIEPAYPQKGNARTDSIFILTLDPGETGKNGVRLINSGEEVRKVEIYAVDESSSVDGSFSCRQKSEARKEVSTWVALSKDTVTLKPGEQTTVDFTVTVPNGADPGEHNGCIAVQDLANLPAKSGEGILLGFRSAIRLAVTVRGDIVKKLALERIDVNRTNEGDYRVAPVVKNTGNVSLDVKSYVQLESIFGQKTEVKDDSTCPVVPGSTFACGYVFQRPYWGGLYKGHVSVSYNSDPKDGLGENVAKQTKIRKDSSYFFVLPDPMAGLAELAGLAIILWLGIAPFRRRARRKRIMHKWEQYVVQDSADTIMSIAATRGVKWRKLARINKIKAPYALKPGQILLVPKSKVARQQRWKRKQKNELEWFLDENSNDTAATPKATDAPQAVVTPINEPSMQPQQTQSTLGVNAALGQERNSSAPVRQASRSEDSWLTPAYVPEEDPVLYDENYVDWREGADEEELAGLESRLGDYTVVPKMRTPFRDEQKAPTKRKPTSRAKSATKRTKSTKKK